MASIQPLKIASGKISQMGTTDTVPTNNLGTGTANSTTALYGDNTWKTVSTAPPAGASLYLFYNY